MYDSNALVRPVYIKVLKEGESEYRVLAFLFLLQKFSFPFFSFENCVIMNLSSLKDVQRRGTQPPKSVIMLRRVAESASMTLLP